MRANFLLPFAAAVALLVSVPSQGQTSWSEVFTRFSLEARGDAMATVGDKPDKVGFQGRYFNLLMGGRLGGGFSYFFRQRIIANKGSVDFFDNTDFLYLNYDVDSHWRLRFGKDALAIGGFEYDAPPIDEYCTTVYWDNFYCFQMAASAAYSTTDGRHSFVFQVSQSPYIKSLVRNWDDGLLAFHFLWNGSLGEHVKTLWSTSMIMRDRDHFTPYCMNLTALGTQVDYDRWNWYFDFLHRALETDDWGKNFSFVSRFNYRLTPQYSLFVKGSYEQNHSNLDFLPGTTTSVDNLVPAGHEFVKAGIGIEYRPIDNVRLHFFSAFLRESQNGDATVNGIAVNFGATWNMDFHKLFEK